MKKFCFSFILFFGLIFTVYGLDIQSKYAILYNLDENKVLFSKNASEETAIASMTKVMTALVAIQNIDSLDEVVLLVPDDFKGLVEANASVANFYVGEELTYLDLLYGLLLPSGADCAQALTRLVAGNSKNFVDMMNAKALEMGLEHTHFVNETGLDADGHYSSMEDVAKIFMEALKNPTLKEIMSTKTYTTSDNMHTLHSTISSYQNRYNLDMDYLIGGKTGDTDNAGLCLGSFAFANGVNYLLITAGASEEVRGAHHLEDAKKIYDYYINNYQNQKIVSKNDVLYTLKTLDAKEKEINVYASEDIMKYLPNDYNKEDIKIVYQGESLVKYNTLVGTKLGVISIFYQDELVSTVDVVLEEKLSLDILSLLSRYKYLIIISFIILFVLFKVVFWHKR